MPQSIHEVGIGSSNGNCHKELEMIAEIERVCDATLYDDSVGFVPLWKDSKIDRREFVRLAMQSFKDMGYTDTLKALEMESGFTLEIDAVTEFRKGILAGKWSLVESLLADLPSEGIVDLVTVKFIIRQQKFLEALEAKETKRALAILRNELTPLNHDSERLHLLSSLIMCATAEDLRASAEWDGVAGSSRLKLLTSLQHYISPSIMIPQRRLETLLEQAKSSQRVACVYHAADHAMSLLADCSCDASSFPSVTTHILKDHSDEIWRLEFSHNGHWLATAGRDKTAIIWNVKNEFSLEKVFGEHTDAVSSLAWSPDDSILLTAAESIIKMWNTTTGKCIATLDQHEYAVGALSWMPDGKGFVSGGMDSKVFFWDLTGNIVSTLAQSPSRVLDLAVSPNGLELVAVGRGEVGIVPPPPTRSGSRNDAPVVTSLVMPLHEKRISVFNIADKKLKFQLELHGELTSVSISNDSQFAIISHAPNEILYIDLKDGTILKRYQGHDQGQYVLKSCFGGALQNYVMSGSEDGQIYVWHRDTGALLNVLNGHGAGTVNAVAWNPNSAQWASVSDDRTVRIWGRSKSPV